MIQVYMPTTEHEEEEVEETYSIIDELLKETDGKDCTIVTGDSNAMVGERSEEKTAEKYGLGKRNQKGERLVNFFKENEYVITNTFFKNHNKKRYT